MILVEPLESPKLQSEEVEGFMKTAFSLFRLRRKTLAHSELPTDALQAVGLDLKSRELMAITALTLQGLGPQLETHLHAALEAGWSEAELMEAFLHLALYAGFPTALFGAKHARKVIRARAEKGA